MKLLLDTHILLWALSDDAQLPEKARKLLESEENEIYYSLVSLREIQLKCLAHPGQVDFTAERVAGYCSESGFYRMSISIEDQENGCLPAQNIREQEHPKGCSCFYFASILRSPAASASFRILSPKLTKCVTTKLK